MKKLLAIVISMAMIVAMMPVGVFATGNSELRTDIGEKTFVAGGDWTEFTFSTVANDDAEKMVYGGSDFGVKYEDKIAALEYKAGDTWINMKGQNFGGSTGFPMADATSTFRVKFTADAVGTYTFTASMKAVDGDTVLCSLEVPFEVKAKGYNNEALPERPVVEGNVINVTAENAQYTLDGAYGSIDGKTINFTENVNTVLHIGRPTKFAESNTEYYVGGYTDAAAGYQKFNTAEELVAYKNQSSWTYGCFYSRTVSNVKFTSNENVTLAGFDMNDATGHVYQEAGKEGPYDCVRDRQIVNGTNDGYYGHINISGLTFDGLTIKNNTDAYAIQFDITSVSNKQNILKGITFKNCSITSTSSNTSEHSGISHFMNNGGTADIYEDITFDSCNMTVTGESANRYGVLVLGTGNLTVNKCSFTGMTRAVQSQSGSNNETLKNEYGSLTITNNKFENIETYVIKVAQTKDMTGLTVTGNNSANSAENCMVRIEPEEYAGTGNVAIYENDWDKNIKYKYDWNKDIAAPVIPVIPSTPADNVTNNPADKNTTADLAPAVKDNKAETTVDAKTADKIVDKAVENNSTEVVIDVAGNNSVASSEVAIPEKTVKELAEKTDANLVIKTDNGKVDLDRTALAAVAEQAGTTGTVRLVVETVKTDENICHVDLKLVTSNGAVKDFRGGNVKVTINLTKELAAKELVCVYIDDNGIYTLVEGVLNADGTYTFVTGHFSEYAVMAKDEADKVIADQLKTMIKDVNLKVRTSKTSKKNIKAVVSGDVKALTDAGYTVKYKFYRSTKKASKYAVLKTKADNTYINTKGKKGTKYYYKAKALVYQGDKLVGQTELKQCKYGVRTWSK